MTHRMCAAAFTTCCLLCRNNVLRRSGFHKLLPVVPQKSFATQRRVPPAALSVKRHSVQRLAQTAACFAAKKFRDAVARTTYCLVVEAALLV